MIKKLLKKILPAEKQFMLVSLKHAFTKFKQTHHSQNGEDIIIRSMFPVNYKGFYIDVGAHHPYRISNTYLLFKKGWTGINIDPNPDTIRLFKKARPKDTNLNIGIGKEEAELLYHRFKDPAVNTFSQKDADFWKQKTWNDYLGTTKVKVEPLGKVLEENLKENQKIDILSVDVEGLDLEVLQSSNWNKFRPSVVIVEAHDFVLEKMHEHPMYILLKEKGYELKYVVKFSLIFTDNGFNKNL